MQNFLEGMETGYGKYKNPYHNSVHAADVLQTTFHILSNSGLMVKLNKFN
jgi:calcium/calmodulin-dependent 3',5'-cyclic nucleotide phosphodiesterase